MMLMRQGEVSKDSANGPKKGRDPGVREKGRESDGRAPSCLGPTHFESLPGVGLRRMLKGVNELVLVCLCRPWR